MVITAEGERHIGWARFIFRKYPRDSYDCGIEVIRIDTFDNGFIGTRKWGPEDMVREAVQDGVDAELAYRFGHLDDGFYEAVGEIWYEYRPGESTPEVPAEPNSWWWLRGPAVTPIEEGVALGLSHKAVDNVEDSHGDPRGGNVLDPIGIGSPSDDPDPRISGTPSVG